MGRREKERWKSKERQEGSGNKEYSQLFRVSSLLLLSLLPFLPSLDGEFIFDDRKTVVENDVVRGRLPFNEVWRRDYWGDILSSTSSHKSFRPLTTITFWLNHALHGLWSPGYHLVNLVLHSLNTLLVHRLFCLLLSQSAEKGKTVAWLASLVFAVHPIHAEAIANITGRAELLMCSFFMAAILVQIDPSLVRESLALPVSSLLTLSSVLCKEQGVTAAIVGSLLFVTLRSEQQSHRRSLGTLLLSSGITLSIAIWRCYLNDWTSPAFSHLDNPASAMKNPLLRVINYAHYWMYSLLLLLFPSPLCFDYAMQCFPYIYALSDYRVLSFLTVILLGLCSLFVLTTVPMTRRYLVSSIVLSIVPFLPASNFLFTVGFTVAERVLYVPSIGVCLLIGWILYEVQLKMKSTSNIRLPRNALPNIGFALLGIAIALSFQRSLQWRSSLSLYSADLAVCPNNAKIHYNLGKVLSDLGRREEAEMRYREAIRLHPGYESALNNLGNLLEAKGDYSTAVDILSEAARVAPSFAAAWMNLGIAQMKMGEIESSESSLSRSLSLRPLSAETHFNLGVLMLNTKRRDKARLAWINATSLDPWHGRAWSNLFILLEEMERCEEVISLSTRALSLLPGLSSLHQAVGTCLATNGRFAEAERELLEAVRIAPEIALNHANLGVLYHRWNRWERALSSYSAALALDPSIGGGIEDNLNSLKQRMNISTTKS